MTRSFRLRTNKLFAHWLPLVGGILLTLWLVWPVISHFQNGLTSSADGQLISYLITWVSLQFQQGASPWQVPFFYPFANTLAYSDPFFSTALFTQPLLWITHQPVIIHNTHLVVGALATWLCSYWAFLQLDRNKLAAFVAATIFSSGIWHQHYIVHLHTYLIAGLPWCWASLASWHRSRHPLWLLSAAAGFLYQMLNSPLSGMFVLFSLVPLLVQNSWRTALRQHWLMISLLAGACVAITGFAYYRYFLVANQFDYTRTIRDAAHFGHSLNRWWQADSILVLALLAWIIWVWPKSTTSQSSQLVVSIKTRVLVMLVGGIMMLGPTLKLNDRTFKIAGLPIPLPYAGAYYGIPGFKGFRTSSRWVVVWGWGWALVTSYFIAKRHPQQLQAVSLVLAVAWFTWLLQRDIWQVYAVSTEPPPIYQLVKNQPEQILLELPVLSWRMMPYSAAENPRLLWQLVHGKTLYNGSSGFTPPQRETDWEWVWHHQLQPEVWDFIKNEGIQLVVVDYALYQRMNADHFAYAQTAAPEPKELFEALQANPQLQLIGCQTDHCLYRLQ